MKNALDFDLKRTFPSCQIYIDAVPKRSICENGSQWCEHSSMNLNCSPMEVHIIEGLLCDVRKSNSWFLLSKYLLLSSWQTMNFNYIEWKIYKTLSIGNWVLSKSHAKTVWGPQNLPKDRRSWGRFCRSPNCLRMGFTFLMDANTSKYFYNF